MKEKTMRDQKTSSQLIDGLSHLLADTYVLYLKTQNFHWNVQGEDFYSYHKMFEEQYQSLAEATDVIAERIRALGAATPASFKQFLMLTSLHEATHVMKASIMVEELLRDHELIAKHLGQLFSIAEKSNDQATLDLFVERKREHDKTAWMLRSTLN